MPLEPVFRWTKAPAHGPAPARVRSVPGLSRKQDIVRPGWVRWYGRLRKRPRGLLSAQPAKTARGLWANREPMLGRDRSSSLVPILEFGNCRRQPLETPVRADP